MVFTAFVVSGLTLSGTTAGGGQLFVTDAWALIGAGVVLGAAALAPLRIRAHADADGIQVHNLVSDYRFAWSLVRAVRYQRGVPWATLELINEEQVPILAVQVSDTTRALDAMRGLRALHARATAPPPPQSKPAAIE
jgi:hypothetical protein